MADSVILLDKLIRNKEVQEQRPQGDITYKEVEVNSGLSYVTIQKLSKDPRSWSRITLNRLTEYFERPLSEVLVDFEDLPIEIQETFDRV